MPTDSCIYLLAVTVQYPYDPLRLRPSSISPAHRFRHMFHSRSLRGQSRCPEPREGGYGWSSMLDVQNVVTQKVLIKLMTKPQNKRLRY